MNHALCNTYTSLLPFLGSAPEPFEVIERADEHREYWRPDRVRLVLLAESHVYTQAAELEHSLRATLPLPAGLPKGYVRLVYALGYGEDKLLDRPISSPRNSGTPQYWKLFYSCLNRVSANEDFGPVQSSRTLLPERLVNKLAVLRGLREQGVWLLDASIAALYSPTDHKPDPDTMSSVIARSWDGYVGPLVEQVQPEGILVIGRGVASRIGDRVQRLGIPWQAIDQPNARVSAAVHMAGFALCHAAARDPSCLAG